MFKDSYIILTSEKNFIKKCYCQWLSYYKVIHLQQDKGRDIMHYKSIRNIFLLLFLFVFTACVEPGNYRMRDRYIVTSHTLYIRSAPSTVSEIIGTLGQGDTVVAVASDRYWIMVRNGYETGYISTDYLKKIDYPVTPKILQTSEKLANWKKWQFWILAIAMLLLWVLAEEWVLKTKQYLKKKFNFNIKEIIVSYVTFFVVALLSGIIYLHWKDYFIESIYKGIAANSYEADIVTITVWVQLSLLAISILYDYLGSIFKTGLRFGTLLTILDVLLGLMAFCITFFLVIALSYYAIAFLLVFFTSRFIHIVDKNSSKPRFRK